MFQRIKGAIDRTIAEEQARQKAINDQAAGTGGGGAHSRQPSSLSRSNSSASTARKPRPKKSAQDASKDVDGGAANTDPAVFEAAFVIDDDEPTRASTPLPPSEKKDKQVQDDVSKGDGAEDTKDPEKGGVETQKTEGDNQAVSPSKSTAAPDLPQEVRAKLRKLEKLEATYPG